MKTISNREVVLGVTGSIAAYKACEIASRLVELGAQVTPVLTPSARELVGPASFEAITGRHVIVVEDIVDTGLTLSYLHGLLATRRPASLATATLIDKVTRRIVDVELQYRGFEIGDEFLLGYGLDWNGRYRNLPSLWAVLDLGVFQEDPESLAREAFRGAGDRLIG